MARIRETSFDPGAWDPDAFDEIEGGSFENNDPWLDEATVFEMIAGYVDYCDLRGVEYRYYPPGVQPILMQRAEERDSDEYLTHSRKGWFSR